MHRHGAYIYERVSAAASAKPCNQTRRPGSGGAGHLRLEAPSRLRTAALWAPEQRLGPAVPPWSPSKARAKRAGLTSLGYCYYVLLTALVSCRYGLNEVHGPVATKFG